MGMALFSGFRRGRDGTKPRLGLDYHSHLLPGVDDGMATYDDAKAAVGLLRGMGFVGAVLTPHVYRGVFDNESAALREAHVAFARSLAADGIDFPVFLAAEYFADEYFLSLIERDDLLSLAVGGERWVLLEFPYLQETPFASACLSALTVRGYRPVVAHVERYRFMAEKTSEWLARFERAGAVLQGDIGSLAGQYGEPVRRMARVLWERRLIRIWGTDLHHADQLGRHIAPGLAKMGAPARLNEVLDPVYRDLAA